MLKPKPTSVEKRGRHDPEPDLHDGQHIDHKHQDSISSKRSQQELVRLKTTNTALVVCLVTVSFVALCCGLGWRQAVDQVEHDVKVAWVKLNPDGTSGLEFYSDNGQSDRYFQATLQSSLINFVEHRYRKRRATIAADYAYALQFLGADEQRKFLDIFNASKVASDFEKCAACEETEVHIRALHPGDTLVDPNRNRARTGIYESTAYITFRPVVPTSKTQEVNKLIKITWQLKPVREIRDNWELLEANPLALEFLNITELDDLAQ